MNNKIIDRSVKMLKPSVISYICYTLILLGPIGWVFYSLITKDYHRIIYLVSLSLCCSVLITLLWVNFILEHLEFKKCQKAIKDDEIND